MKLTNFGSDSKLVLVFRTLHQEIQTDSFKKQSRGADILIKHLTGRLGWPCGSAKCMWNHVNVSCPSRLSQEQDLNRPTSFQRYCCLKSRRFKVRNLRVVTYLLSNAVTFPVSRGGNYIYSVYSAAVHITSLPYNKCIHKAVNYHRS